MPSHHNYFTFSASTNFELGLQMGETFKNQLISTLEQSRSKSDWQEKVLQGISYLSPTQTLFPQYIDELKGYAQGASVSFEELWTLSLEDELHFYKKEKCTTIVTNQGKLLSHNEDWSEDAQDSICVVKKTVNDISIFELFYVNTLGGNSISINSYGFVQSINTLTHTDWQLGVPRNVIGRWISETKDPQADFEKLKQIKRSLGYNHVLIHKDGKMWNIECSSQKQEMTNPQAPFVHTNHYLGRLKELEGEKRSESNSTFNRFEKASALVKPTLDEQELIVLTNNTDEGKKISILNERTIAKMIVNFETNSAKIWLKREDELGWVDYDLNKTFR